MTGDGARRKVTKPVKLTLEKEFNGIFLPLRLGNRVVKFLVDTGACWTLMSLALVDACGLRDAMTVIHEGGLVTIGVLEAEAECEGGYTLHFVVAIMHRLDTPLLGMNFLLRYGCMLVLDPEVPLMIVRPSSVVKLGLLCGVYKKCKLADHLVTAILDTGSTHSFISRTLAKEFRMRRRFCRPMLVTLFDGTITIMFRKVPSVEINIDGLRYSTDLIIHPNKNVSLLLGMNILSGSTLCLQQQEITLSSTNSCFIGGEQDPKPSSISLTPPQFSVLTNSSRFVSGTAKKKKGRFSRIKKWLKTSKWFKWLGSEGRSGNEAGSVDGNEAGNVSRNEQGGESGEGVESEGGKTTTVSENEERSGSEDEQGTGSER